MPAMARLLIHAAEGGGGGADVLAWAQQRWRAWAGARAGQVGPAPTGLHIADLQGREFFTCADAHALTDVALPAGTYHIELRWRGRQRRYTVTLASDATVNLYLHPTAIAAHP